MPLMQQYYSKHCRGRWRNEGPLNITLSPPAQRLQRKVTHVILAPVVVPLRSEELVDLVGHGIVGVVGEVWAGLVAG